MAEINTKRYLDEAGLDALWSKIKEADAVNASAIAELDNRISDAESAANDAYDVANNVQSDLSTLSSTVVDLNDTVATHENQINNIQIKLETLSPEEIVYAKISKNDEDIYVTDREDRSALSGTVVVALNELKESFKSIDHSNYYTKNESDEKFVLVDSFLNNNDINSIFK